MALKYRHKQRRTVYTSVKEELGGLLSVTTVNTPYPYLVQAKSVEIFDTVQDKKMKLPMPRSKNRGPEFYRGDQWVSIPPVHLGNTTWLCNQIETRKRGLYKFTNKDSLQMEVDYIAAMEYRLENPHE